MGTESAKIHKNSVYNKQGYKTTWRQTTSKLNPLTLESDKHVSSSYNIHT